MSQKEEQQHKEIEDSFLCPSFSTYSSNKLSHIADQVTKEDHSLPQNDTDLHQNGNDEADFEFVAFRKAADAVFFNRHTGPVFPIFNRDLAENPPDKDDGGRISGAEEIRFSMEKLLIGDEEDNRRSDPPSSSSSEAGDDLDAIPPGTYCVWTPNPVQASPNRCKKSNSTGSSSSPSPAKRWKLLDLLRRSNSGGKNSFVFLTPSSSSLGSNSAKKEKKKKEEGANAKGKSEFGGRRLSNEIGGSRVTGKNSPAAVSAHEALYVRNREMRRLDKRRSYLPYKQDLIGFCTALNGMGGRTFPPF